MGRGVKAGEGGMNGSGDVITQTSRRRQILALQCTFASLQRRLMEDRFWSAFPDGGVNLT